MRKINAGAKALRKLGNIVAETSVTRDVSSNVSLFAHPWQHCCGNKICFPGSRNVSYQIQKHFMFPKCDFLLRKHCFLVFSRLGKHGETSAGNNVSATKCFLVCPGLKLTTAPPGASVHGAVVSVSAFHLWVVGSILYQDSSNVSHVQRVSQRSAESRGFSPGTPVSSHREGWRVVYHVLAEIRKIICRLSTNKNTRK